MSKLIPRGIRKGKARKVWQCCREIRIQCPKTLGKAYSGFNTLAESNQVEYYILIKINKNYNDNILQRIYPNEKQLKKLREKYKHL